MKTKMYNFNTKNNADEMYLKIKKRIIKKGFKLVSTHSHFDLTCTNREFPYQLIVTSYKQSA